MLAEWARDAKACKASGMTVKDWCASKGLNINTYRYRCQRLRVAAEEELTVQQDTGKKIPSAVQKKQNVNKRAIPVYTEMVHLFNSTGGLPLTMYFQITSLCGLSIRDSLLRKNGGCPFGTAACGSCM